MDVVESTAGVVSKMIGFFYITVSTFNPYNIAFSFARLHEHLFKCF